MLPSSITNININIDTIRSVAIKVTFGLGCFVVSIAASHIAAEAFYRTRSWVEWPLPLGHAVSTYNAAPSFLRRWFGGAAGETAAITTATGSENSKTQKVPTCIITGGMKGIGECLQQRLVELGYKVEVWDRSVDNGADVKQSDASVLYRRVDVSCSDDVDAACDDFLARHGGDGPDLLILNAGAVQRTGIGLYGKGQVERAFATNVTVHAFGALNKLLMPMARAVNDGNGRDLPDPKFAGVEKPKWRRSVVLMSSVTGFSGNAYASEYCASKAAMTSLGDAAREETRVRFNNNNNGSFVPVDVLTVCPYVVRTQLFDFALHFAPWFLPPLDPGYVADQTIKSVQKRRTTICLPSLFYTMPVLRWAFPDFYWQLSSKLMEAHLWVAPECVQKLHV